MRFLVSKTKWSRRSLNPERLKTAITDHLQRRGRSIYALLMLHTVSRYRFQTFRIHVEFKFRLGSLRNTVARRRAGLVCSRSLVLAFRRLRSFAFARSFVNVCSCLFRSFVRRIYAAITRACDAIRCDATRRDAERRKRGIYAEGETTRRDASAWKILSSQTSSRASSAEINRR